MLIFCLSFSRRYLLDQDQEIPAPIDTTYLKFRFYYEVYDPSRHKNLVRLWMQTERDSSEWDGEQRKIFLGKTKISTQSTMRHGPPFVEHPFLFVEHLFFLFPFFHEIVVKAPEGTLPEDAVQTITARFQVKDIIQPCSVRQADTCTGQPSQGVELIYVSGHCHAATCISMELYNADTGDLICRVTPIWGTGDEVYNEAGYLTLPPCLFGHQPGLLPPQFLGLETNLLSIAKSNNTYGH